MGRQALVATVDSDASGAQMPLKLCTQPGDERCLVLGGLTEMEHRDEVFHRTRTGGPQVNRTRRAGIPVRRSQLTRRFAGETRRRDIQGEGAEPGLRRAPTQHLGVETMFEAERHELRTLAQDGRKARRKPAGPVEGRRRGRCAQAPHGLGENEARADGPQRVVCLPGGRHRLARVVCRRLCIVGGQMNEGGGIAGERPQVWPAGAGSQRAGLPHEGHRAPAVTGPGRDTRAERRQPNLKSDRTRFVQGLEQGRYQRVGLGVPSPPEEAPCQPQRRRDVPVGRRAPTRHRPRRRQERFGRIEMHAIDGRMSAEDGQLDECLFTAGPLGRLPGVVDEASDVVASPPREEGAQQGDGGRRGACPVLPPLERAERLPQLPHSGSMTARADERPGVVDPASEPRQFAGNGPGRRRRARTGFGRRGRHAVRGPWLGHPHGVQPRALGGPRRRGRRCPEPP